MLYFAISERLHVSSTICGNCQTCHQTISIAGQLQIIRLMLQLQHNTYLDIMQSSNNHSLIELNSRFIKYVYVHLKLQFN